MCLPYMMEVAIQLKAAMKTTLSIVTLVTHKV